MMSVASTAAIAQMLDIPLRRARPLTPMELVTSIETGLKPQIVAKIAKTIAPDSATFSYLFVSKATLARRLSQKKRLTADESARLARAARIWTHARAIWQSDALAREFLFRPHPMLDGRAPIETAISTDLGAELVDQLLGRLEYGSAA
jgi:putative toxin-antitoxin system antitoxin component (TIGR02293 family)